MNRWLPADRTELLGRLCAYRRLRVAVALPSPLIGAAFAVDVLTVPVLQRRASPFLGI